MQQGSLIGHPLAASPNGDKVLVQNESGTADLAESFRCGNAAIRRAL
ncbi:MAG: hypothetical protein WA672_16975 [Candidatus Angelobacter sp.]